MNEFFAWVTGLIAVVIPGFGTSEPLQWNGYVEADYVYVGALSPGAITTMDVHEGQMVQAGAVLFAQENRQQQAALDAAEAQVEVARANAENLATGSRAEEIDVIRANLAKAEADFDLAQSQSERSDQLLAQGLTPQAQADQARATLRSAEAQVAQLQAQLRVAELPARDPQRIAAEASLAVAEANAERARDDLADRISTAPEAGRIERIFFAEGEIVGAGAPVLSLLPEGALKIRFYVPQAERATMALGDAVSVTCDGCAAEVSATISFMASDPQFTPPVIYSRDERHRLTFLVEAELEADASLAPGQPVSVLK